MKNKLLRYSSLNHDFATLILRLMFGSLMVYYGYSKVTNYSAMDGKFPDPIGLGSTLSLQLVIFAEFVCGFLVLIGLLTRLAIIPIFINMFVIYFIVHADDDFNSKQIALIHLVLCLVLFITGSGKFSVDRFLFKA